MSASTGLQELARLMRVYKGFYEGPGFGYKGLGFLSKLGLWGLGSGERKFMVEAIECTADEKHQLHDASISAINSDDLRLEYPEPGAAKPYNPKHNF